MDESEFRKAVREALLLIVDALERMERIRPTTAELRRAYRITK